MYSATKALAQRHNIAQKDNPRFSILYGNSETEKHRCSWRSQQSRGEFHATLLLLLLVVVSRTNSRMALFT